MLLAQGGWCFISRLAKEDRPWRDPFRLAFIEPHRIRIVIRLGGADNARPIYSLRPESVHQQLMSKRLVLV